MLAAHWLAFLGVAALLTVTPGPDMAIVTRSALGHGRSAAWRTTLGINLGLVLWAVAAAFGVAALLATSATAFTALKLVGGAYLIFLGVRILVGHAAGADAAGADDAGGDDASGDYTSGDVTSGNGAASFRRGLLTNLLNPKIGVFYTTLLPQFVNRGHSVLAQSLALALAHDLMGLLWLPLYAELVIRAGDLLRRPRVRRGLDRVTAGVLVALGVRLALERR